MDCVIGALYIINWRKDELEAMDMKTRKIMTTYTISCTKVRMSITSEKEGDRRGLISQH